MRIQHNIMAMNAYRNYNTNTKMLSGNLEKLSSGYKINRAGDDAAGLAISEKMRAQITGLDAAQKNVKDGISLVKTAEGAMQEIQDMLNRMDYLATQSANGTYQNEVDRENLQKEVNNLKTEINRIADSANFNGIKLLDGSLDSGAKTVVATDLSQTGAIDKNSADGDLLKADVINATTGKYTTKSVVVPSAATKVNAGDVMKFDFQVKDKDGGTQSITVELTVSADKSKLIGSSGTQYDFSSASTTPAASEVATALASELQKNETINSAFKVSAAKEDGTVDATTATANIAIVFDARSEGAGMEVLSAGQAVRNAKGDVAAGYSGVDKFGVQVPTAPQTVTVRGEDESNSLNLANVKIWDGKDKTLEDCTFEIGGKKFVFVDTTVDMAAAAPKMNAAGITCFEQTKATGVIDNSDVTLMAKHIATATGMTVEQGTNTAGVWAAATSAGNTSIRILAGSTSTSGGGGGLTLQIGDTSDKFNQMKVVVGDMHTSAMGKGKATLDGKEINVTKTIADIDIGTQEGAAEAVQVIKNAINYVSSVRGDLGAVQNRLDHTANNLSVMAENIQDAESTIRDTDVANEMMSYVKNNILVQSAQAMLAQANQVPQGVLQLLG